MKAHSSIRKPTCLFLTAVGAAALVLLAQLPASAGGRGGYYDRDYYAAWGPRGGSRCYTPPPRYVCPPPRTVYYVPRPVYYVPPPVVYYPAGYPVYYAPRYRSGWSGGGFISFSFR